ncbi:hypothetical protein ACFLXQ_04200 [Chloroflexota bacterium]
MSKITIDLVKLIEQAAPQVLGSIDPLLLQQWQGRNTGTEQPVTVDLAAVPVKDKAEMITPPLPDLQFRINDVITFTDGSELRVHILAPPGNSTDLATDAYHGLLAAISNI